MPTDVIPRALSELHHDEQGVIENLLIRRGIPSQDVQDGSGMLKRLATIVAFHHADHLGCQVTSLLEASNLKAGL